MLRPKHQKRLLSLAALGLCGLATVTLAWGFAAPEPEMEPSSTEALATADSGPAATPKPSLSSGDFQEFWERPLRRPLYDPPPPAPAPVEKKPPPPLAAKLLATMIEPGNSSAMLELRGGEVVFRKLGESVEPQDDGTKITAIEPGKIVVQRGDDETKLSVDGTGN